MVGFLPVFCGGRDGVGVGGCYVALMLLCLSRFMRNEDVCILFFLCVRVDLGNA